MENDRLERVIGIMVQIPPILKRKLHRDIFNKTMFAEIGTDIAPHHWMILKELHESEMMHGSEIADMVCMAKPQITQSINRLIRLGLVEKQTDTEDRRRINIRLTQKGRETVDRFEEIIINHMKARLSVLEDGDLEKLADSFEVIAKTFSNLR